MDELGRGIIKPEANNFFFLGYQVSGCGNDGLVGVELCILEGRCEDSI